MRNTLYLFVSLFLLSFYACKENAYPQVLLLADNLTNSNPDSAVSLLCSIKDDMSAQSEETQMYYRLLCVKADDKAYIPLTSENRILPVLHYYIKKDDTRHLPEAYFYAGRTYRDLGDAPQALDYFDKALDVLGDDSCCELRSLIHSQMGRIFSEQGLWNEARKVYSQAYRWSVLEKDSISMIYDLRDLASTYCDVEGIDSSLLYYQEAYDLASALNNPRIMSMVQSQIGKVYVQMGKYDLVKKILQPSLKTTVDRIKSGVYSITADWYYKMGNRDSASYYYNKLLGFGTLYALTDAHWRLAELALEEGKIQVAKGHLEQYMEKLDSVRKFIDSETIREINSLYNYSLRESENSCLKAENKQEQIYLFYSMTGGVVMSLCFFTYFQYSRRKHAQFNLQLLRLKRIEEEQYKKSALFIEENKRKQEELTQLLRDGAYPAQQKELIEQQKRSLYYAGKQAEFGLQEREKARRMLLDSDICKYFKEICNEEKDTHLPPEKWNLLEQTVNTAYKDFTEKLFRICKLSRHELHICLLIKIDILPKDMARLTDRSRESITSVRRRLYEKFFGTKGTPQQWDEFIDSL